MIFKNLTTKGLYDKRWFLLGWSIGIVAMVVLVMLFYPSFSQDDSFEKALGNIPEQLKAFVGDISALKTLSGYTGSQLFDIRLPLLTLVMGIMLAVNLSAAEEESGRLRQLLVQPISRFKIMFEKWLTMTIIIAFTHIVAWLSLIVSMLTINDWLEPSSAAAATLMCFLLTTAISTITFATGFATGKRGLTIALGSLLAFGSFFLTSFALGVQWLKKLDVVSLFHYYKAGDVLTDGLVWWNVIILTSVILASLIISAVRFNIRDTN